MGPRVGQGAPWVRGRLGRLILELTPARALGAPAGVATLPSGLARGEQLAFYLAGPAANALAALLLLPFVGSTSGIGKVVLLGTIAMSALGALLNLVPRSVGGLASDGRRALALLRAS